ncbi:MAG: hypothetical protein WKF42_02175 [Solirubrobacteraceae bacterium]
MPAAALMTADGYVARDLEDRRAQLIDPAMPGFALALDTLFAEFERL